MCVWGGGEVEGGYCNLFEYAVFFSGFCVGSYIDSVLVCIGSLCGIGSMCTVWWMCGIGSLSGGCVVLVACVVLAASVVVMLYWQSE